MDKKYEEDRMGMEKGKQTEYLGIKEKDKFLSEYPIEFIPNLTIKQYASGDKSFSRWLLYGLPNITKPGNVLEDIKKKNYNNFNNYKINSIMKNMLMIVYFYDRFVPVRTEPTIDDCLKRVSISLEKKSTMIEKNLALVEWKKDVPALADWSNQMVLDFCLWLNRKNITTNKEELCNNAVIEEVQKIEEEISSLNVEGASKKAIINARINQGRFRDLLLKRYNRCCLCGLENHTLLIASHIKPWAESEPKEKLDVDNGFLMCPNHDRVFDKGYITFDDDGKIIISDKLTENDRMFLNVDSRRHIELTESNKKYLKFHRENIFNK